MPSVLHYNRRRRLLQRFEEGVAQVEPEQPVAEEQAKPEDAVVEAPEVEDSEESAGNSFLSKTIGHLPTSVSRWLNAHGRDPISNLKIHRVPISNVLNKVLDVISGGKFSKIKSKLNMDKLYHLSISFSCKGRTYTIEKNQVLKIYSGFEKGGETYPIQSPAGLTMRDMMLAAIKKYGYKKLTVYDGLKWNCQLFVAQFLSASGLLTAGAKAFTYQNVSELVRQLPKSSQKTGKKATDLASIADRALQFLSRGYLRLKDGGVV